jgi:hypothetical protein
MNIRVIQYSDIEDITRELIQIEFIRPIPTSKNSHFKYFKEYFKKRNVQTVVLEYPYIDKDYLEDYARYYVKSFKEYKKSCVRLHLFKKISFTEHELKNLLIGIPGKINDSLLINNYLGFIVLKPIPLTLIGRTCLKTYPDGQGRQYPITRTYTAHLSGLALTVESLAFQEQDSNVSACATNALWSAFQGTGILFHHVIPSPVEITEDATRLLPLANRTFPNKGLSSEQMAHAIRKVGLEPVVLKFKNFDLLKATVYAFLKGGIPIVLGIRLHDKEKKIVKTVGEHAVTITGFKTAKRRIEEFDIDGIEAKRYAEKFYLYSSHINKIFVHDDQLGPFARMEFDNKNSPEEKTKNIISLSTSWSTLYNDYTEVRAEPLVEIIPLYHKIRIPFYSILRTSIRFSSIVTSLPKITDKIEWEIYVTTVVKFKKDIRDSHVLEPSEKERVLYKPMPKYLWLANARIKNLLNFQLVFDATDLQQGDMFLLAVHYDERYFDIVTLVSHKTPFDDLKAFQTQIIFKWYRETFALPNIPVSIPSNSTNYRT